MTDSERIEGLLREAAEAFGKLRSSQSPPPAPGTPLVGLAPGQRDAADALIAAGRIALESGQLDFCYQVQKRFVPIENEHVARILGVVYIELAELSLSELGAGRIHVDRAAAFSTNATAAIGVLRLDAEERTAWLAQLAHQNGLARGEAVERLLLFLEWTPELGFKTLHELSHLDPEVREKGREFATKMQGYLDLQPAADQALAALAAVAPRIELPPDEPVDYHKGVILAEIERASAFPPEEPEADDRIEELVRVTVRDWAEERGDHLFAGRIVERSMARDPRPVLKGMRSAMTNGATAETCSLFLSVIPLHNPSFDEHILDHLQWLGSAFPEVCPQIGEIAEQRGWTLDFSPPSRTINVGRPTRPSVSPRRPLIQKL